MPRLPAARESTQQAERSFLAAAQSSDLARTWFNVGFFRELNGDRAGAVQALSRALQNGLGDAPAADYAKAALARLARQR